MLTNAEIKTIRSLREKKFRDELGLFTVEGEKSVAEALASSFEVVRVLRAEDIGASAMERISQCATPSPVLAVVRMPKEDMPAELPDGLVLALDSVRDPGNFGTICRTLRSTGLTELWYTRGSVDPYGDKAVRSALGAQFALSLRSFENLETLRQQAARFGYPTVYLTDPHTGEDCFRCSGLFDRSVVVIGAEADGVSALNGAARVTIPMPGNYESLNAAQAATVFLFEYVRRITAPAPGGILS